MPNQNNITIQSVELQNVLAFKTMNLELGKKATIISGKNHSFKSCLLEAIKAGVRGGTIKDIPLVHDGESKGKIITITSDDKEFTKTLYFDKASKLSVVGAGGASAAEALTELFGAAYIDPVKMYNADPEKRVEMCYSVMPLKFDRVAFAKLVDSKILPDSPALAEIDAQYKRYYEERKDANGDLKKAKLRLEDARRTLPLDPPTDLTEQISLLENQKSNIDAKLKDAQTAAATTENSRKNEYLTKRDAAIKLAYAEYDASMAELAAKVKAHSEALQSKHDEIVMPVLNELAAIKEKQKNFERETLQVANFEKIQSEHDAAEIDAANLDKIVKGIETIRENLIKDTGIDGVDIKDGDVWIDGTIWTYVNRAKRILFCVQMAEMSCRNMKLIIVDDVESLDAENYELLLEHIGKSDYQFVLAQVDRTIEQDEMRIEKID